MDSAERSNTKLGLRVVRGPDWKYGNTIAWGLVGTVVEIDGQGGSSLPAKSVGVVWDNSVKCYYRAGCENAYDLHIYENAQCGVVHEYKTCKGCREKEIAGLRWKCADCSDTDLCTLCYMSDKHDIAHTFFRYDTQLSSGVRVPLRCDSNNDKRLAKGIFKGGFVKRGPDWSTGNQDGGAGKTGQVVDISKWGDVFVRWSSGKVYQYHMGSNGKVELVLADKCFGNMYYESHLPLLGTVSKDTTENFSQRISSSAYSKTTDMNSFDAIGKAFSTNDSGHRNNANDASVKGPTQQLTTSPTTERKSLFKIEDTVKISVDFTTLMRLQQRHGEIPSSMIQHISKVGTVLSITDNGDVNVKFEDSESYTLNPKALSKAVDTSKPKKNDITKEVNVEPKLVRRKCTICLTVESNMAFNPCGHMACCQECSKRFQICPICRGAIKSCLRIFFP